MGSGIIEFPAWELNSGKLLRVSVREGFDSSGADVPVGEGNKFCMEFSGRTSSWSENRSTHSVKTIGWVDSGIGCSLDLTPTRRSMRNGRFSIEIPFFHELSAFEFGWYAGEPVWLALIRTMALAAVPAGKSLVKCLTLIVRDSLRRKDQLL